VRFRCVPGSGKGMRRPFLVYVVAALALIALVALAVLLPLLLLVAAVDFVRVVLLGKPPLVDWRALPGALLRALEGDVVVALALGALALAALMALRERVEQA
jgi:hypothetical protein